MTGSYHQHILLSLAVRERCEPVAVIGLWASLHDRIWQRVRPQACLPDNKRKRYLVLRRVEGILVPPAVQEQGSLGILHRPDNQRCKPNAVLRCIAFSVSRSLAGQPASCIVPTLHEPASSIKPPLLEARLNVVVVLLLNLLDFLGCAVGVSPGV